MDFPAGATALIVIDVQKAFDQMEAAGAKRNNPDAVSRITELLAAFRRSGNPVIHIRHENLNPQSRFHPSQSGHEVREEAREMDGEPVLVKTVNSAFIGTDLDARLKRDGISHVVIVGATTNHCVETTTRMAGNLGYQTFLVSDATWTFDRKGLDNRVFSAQDIHDMSLANLQDEFCQVVLAGDVVTNLAATRG
jgi:nicotinamidase-related amidase